MESQEKCDLACEDSVPTPEEYQTIVDQEKVSPNTKGVMNVYDLLYGNTDNDDSHMYFKDFDGRYKGTDVRVRSNSSISLRVSTNIGSENGFKYRKSIMDIRGLEEYIKRAKAAILLSDLGFKEELDYGYVFKNIKRNLIIKDSDISGLDIMNLEGDKLYHNSSLFNVGYEDKKSESINNKLHGLVEKYSSNNIVSQQLSDLKNDFSVQGNLESEKQGRVLFSVVTDELVKSGFLKLGTTSMKSRNYVTHRFGKGDYIIEVPVQEGKYLFGAIDLKKISGEKEDIYTFFSKDLHSILMKI